MIDITSDTIRRIQVAFDRRGVCEVTLKREQGEITVLAVKKEKME